MAGLYLAIDYEVNLSYRAMPDFMIALAGSNKLAAGC